MDRYQFNETFPALGSAFGVFCDSPAHDDERLAREVYSGDPPAVRAGLIADALADAHRFMTTIDRDWEVLRGETNRRLYTLDEARSWLMRVMTAWQQELTRLQSGSDSDLGY